MCPLEIADNRIRRFIEFFKFIMPCMGIAMITDLYLFCDLQTIPGIVLTSTGKNMFPNNKKCYRYLLIFYNVKHIFCALVGPIIKREVNFFLFLFYRYHYLHCFFFDAVVLYRSEEHTSELQSQSNLVCRLLLEKKK